jgi:hypothetical protein
VAFFVFKVRLHLLCIGCGMRAHILERLEDMMASDLFLVAGVVLVLLGFWFAGLTCVGLGWLVYRMAR